MRKSIGIFLILGLLIILNWQINNKIDRYRLEVKKMQTQIEHLRWSQYQLEKQINNFLEKWNVEVFEVTAYAPLDPRAEEGVCYSGDPRITSSGKRTTPGVTIAAGKNIPFGTKMYIKGIGWREVHDRGPAIGRKNIDLCVWTQEEAYEIGRRKAVVVWQS